LSKAFPEPFFVKIGANDGITGDTSSDPLSDTNWKGLIIEPVPYSSSACEQIIKPVRRRVKYCSFYANMETPYVIAERTILPSMRRLKGGSAGASDVPRLKPDCLYFCVHPGLP
jgi:hypothetical protein